MQLNIAPFIEPLIGTVQREYSDHTFFWGRHDLQQKLDTFKDNYNDYRVHAGLEGKTPQQKISSVKPGTVKINDRHAETHCTGCFKHRLALKLGIRHRQEYTQIKKATLFRVQPSAIWRPQGDSNPCYRRERAVS